MTTSRPFPGNPNSVWPVVHDEQVRQFWAEFDRVRLSVRRPTVWQRQGNQLPESLLLALQCVNSKLSAVFEFDDDSEKPSRFVITPSDTPEIRPLISALIDRAPPGLDFKLSQFRSPKPFALVRELWSANSPVCEFPKKCIVRCADHHCVGIEFAVDDLDDNVIRNARCVFSDAVRLLLGDKHFEQWISSVDVTHAEPDRRFAEVVSMGEGEDRWITGTHELYDVVTQTIHFIQLGLPDHGLAEWSDREVSAAAATGRGVITSSGNDERELGTVFELFPTERDAYPSFSDIVAAYTRFEELWLAEHSAVPFYSCRFSKHRELFCYLKIDGRQHVADTPFEDRGEIEDAITEALCDADAGLITGGATGLHYSYVDLALSDFSVGLATIRALLRKARLHKQCWVEFFDFDLKSLWIPMDDAMPEPPGHEIPRF